MPTLGKLLLEGAVVGAGTVVLFFCFHMIAMKMVGEEAMSSHVGLAIQVFLCGSVFHVLFEEMGWNKKFCDMRKEEYGD
jgi:hypothetical protein